MSDDQENISWNPALETLIAQEAERCSGLSWLHGECEAYFALRTNIIALPVIILSTVNGFLSGSSQIIFSDQTASSIGVGVISLFAGVLSTIGSYFAWANALILVANAMRCLLCGPMERGHAFKSCARSNTLCRRPKSCRPLQSHTCPRHRRCTCSQNVMTYRCPRHKVCTSPRYSQQLHLCTFQ